MPRLRYKKRLLRRRLAAIDSRLRGNDKTIVICAILIAYSIIHSAQANATDPSNELKTTQEQLAQAREREKALAAQAKEIKEQREKLSNQMVELAARLQRNERDLTLAEEKLSILSEQLEKKDAALKEQRRQLDAMVAAAIRLSQMPPEAAVMMPGDPTQTIEAAQAVKLTGESIRKQSASLADEMKELFALKEKVSSGREESRNLQAKLKSEQAEMDASIKERSQLYAKTRAAHQREEKKSKELAQKSEDLQALLAALEKARKEKEEAAKKAAAEEARERERLKEQGEKPPAPRPKSKPLKDGTRSFEAAKGSIRLPVAGRLAKSYSPASGRKGIVLETRAHARVTAPFDGEVVFTGPFLNYGKIVILRHTEDYYTLLAGLNDIDAQTGDYVKEGEPVGSMGDGDSELYLELRKENQPLNPAPFMAGLKGKS